jgi:hypothetical protein
MPTGGMHTRPPEIFRRPPPRSAFSSRGGATDCRRALARSQGMDWGSTGQRGPMPTHCTALVSCSCTRKCRGSAGRTDSLLRSSRKSSWPEPHPDLTGRHSAAPRRPPPPLGVQAVGGPRQRDLGASPRTKTTVGRATRSDANSPVARATGRCVKYRFVSQCAQLEQTGSARLFQSGHRDTVSPHITRRSRARQICRPQNVRTVRPHTHVSPRSPAAARRRCQRGRSQRAMGVGVARLGVSLRPEADANLTGAPPSPPECRPVSITAPLAHPFRFLETARARELRDGRDLRKKRPARSPTGS